VDALGVFDNNKKLFTSVTFLDSTRDAPEKPYYLGRGATPSVLGWVTWNGSGYDAVIAAEGGINASQCCDGLFKDCTGLRSIDFGGAFHTDETRIMQDMFLNCESLESLDVSELRTSSAESMYQMFRGCKSLETLDIRNFDTSSVKYMYGMFSTCANLRELQLGNFDTSNVDNMGIMFSACHQLRSLDVSTFDTSRVWNMEMMFCYCENLEDLDLRNWEIGKVTNHSMFLNQGKTINGRPWEEFFQ